MRATRIVPSLFTATLIAGLVPAAADAATTPRALALTGTVPAVVVVDGGRTLALKPSAVKRYRGGELETSCSAAVGATGRRAGRTVSFGATVGEVRRFELPKGFDQCIVRITLTRKRTRTTSPIAAVALNDTGYDSLYQLVMSRVLGSTADLATPGAVTGRPADTARIVKLLDGTRVLGKKIAAVAIPSPRTPVAVGQVGVLVSGTTTAATARTPGGRELYLDYDRAGRDLATNVLESLNDESLVTSVETTP